MVEVEGTPNPLLQKSIHIYASRLVASFYLEP
jgi:hypothetical protein